MIKKIYPFENSKQVRIIQPKYTKNQIYTRKKNIKI